jgi:hypothetical protein
MATMNQIDVQTVLVARRALLLVAQALAQLAEAPRPVVQRLARSQSQRAPAPPRLAQALTNVLCALASSQQRAYARPPLVYPGFPAWHLEAKPIPLPDY